MSAPWDGRPANPERDGWHWLRSNGRGDVAASWQREALLRNGKTHTGVWWIDGADYTPTHVIAEAWHYLGPCLTPAEHAAAVQAERDACLAIVQNVYPVTNGATGEWRKARNAILARGDTSALAAAVEAARREEREACAVLAEDHERAARESIIEGGGHEAVGGVFAANEIAAAIRARSGGKEGA